MVVLTIKLTQFCPHLGADVRVGRPEVFLDPVRYPKESSPCRSEP
jgi:hypothetical protein